MDVIPASAWSPILELIAVYPILSFVVIIIGGMIFMYSIYLNMYKTHAENNQIDAARRQSETNIIDTLNNQITLNREASERYETKIMGLDTSLTACNYNLLENVKMIYEKDIEIRRLQSILDAHNIEYETNNLEETQNNGNE